MTAPMFLDAQGLLDLSQRTSKVHVQGNIEQQMTIVRASFELKEASRRLDALAAVTAERDQARQNARNWWAQSDKWERIARDEREKGDQARQMLADARHDDGCDCSYVKSDNEWVEVVPCTCWKAGL